MSEQAMTAATPGQLAASERSGDGPTEPTITEEEVREMETNGVVIRRDVPRLLAALRAARAEVEEERRNRDAWCKLAGERFDELAAAEARERALRSAATAVVNSYGSGDWEIRGGTRVLIGKLAAALASPPSPTQECKP